MKYADGKAFRRALEARLRSESLESGVPLVRLRKTVAFDRLLARLEAGAPGVWALKGGLAPQARLEERARTTKDVDLHTRESAERAIELLTECALVDVDDFFAFRVSRPAELTVLLRCGVEALLDGRTFETFHVDVGTSEDLVGSLTHVRVTSLLSFAGIPPVEFPCLPLGQHIAEKVHCLVRGRASGESSRVKDLVDLVLIAETFEVDAEEASAAVSAVFGRHGMHVPTELPRLPSAWIPQYRRLARELELESEAMDRGIVRATALVGPLLKRCAVGMWDPEVAGWVEHHPSGGGSRS